MLTGRPSTQHTSSTPISIELNALFEKTNINALLQEQAIAEFSSKHLQALMWKIAPEDPMPSSELKASEQERVELNSYPESDYQWLVDVLETLSDIVSRNLNNDFAALTEADYDQLDVVLKELIYVVGDDEKHPLASLMDFTGVLITKYEDEHFPKLTDMFPELGGDVNSNDIKNKNQQDSPTEEPEKPTNALAAEAFFSIGNLLLEGDKKEEAISAYNKAIRLDSEYAHAYYNRGRTKGLLGRYGSAVVDFDKSLQLESDDVYAYVMRGCAKIGLARYEAAIADFDKSLKLKPDEAYAYFMRGYVKNILERYESAIADFDKSLQLEPDVANVYFMRGHVKNILERYESAIADFDKNLKLKPDEVYTYFKRGCAKFLLGRYKSAVIDFDETLRLKPDDTRIYFARGCVRMQLECYEAAIADFDKSLQLEPDEAYAYFMRGCARVKLGRYQSALTDCNKAIQLNPSLAEAYDTRGQINAFLGRTKKAKADFQKVLALAEETNDRDIKTEIEQSLQELDNTE